MPGAWPEIEPFRRLFQPRIYKLSRVQPSRQFSWIESNHRVVYVEYLHPHGPQTIRAGEGSARLENPVSFPNRRSCSAEEDMWWSIVNERAAENTLSSNGVAVASAICTVTFASGSRWRRERAKLGSTSRHVICPQ